MSVWYPGAERRDGARAGYDRGRNRMEVVKLHYTVGVNSTARGDEGYFTFLVSRNGHIAQFAPVDAVCWDSSEWNDAGPGIEFEYMAEHDGDDSNIVNDVMAKAAKGLVAWLKSEHGFHDAFYDGARVHEFDGWRGFITHRSLIQTDQHYDYITKAQWDAISSKTNPINWMAIALVVLKRRMQISTMEGPEMVHLVFGGADNYFYVRPDGTLTQNWWDATAKRWNVGHVNGMAQQPAYRVDKTRPIVGRTKALHGCYNDIELGWIGTDGEAYHSWYNSGTGWGAEPLPKP